MLSRQDVRDHVRELGPRLSNPGGECQRVVLRVLPALQARPCESARARGREWVSKDENQSGLPCFLFFSRIVFFFRDPSERVPCHM